MHSSAFDSGFFTDIENDHETFVDCDVVEFKPVNGEAGISKIEPRESLSENFLEEIEQWARHSKGLNGFCDY